MKKRWIVLLLLIFLLLLQNACAGLVPMMPGTIAQPLEETEETEGDFLSESFYSFLGWDELGETYYDNTPMAVSYSCGDEAASPLFDRATVIRVCDILRNAMVVSETEMPAEGERETYTLYFADGNKFSFSLQNGALCLNYGVFVVEGLEGLAELVFPGYAEGVNIFSLYNDDAIVSFAENFAQNTPVSVGLRSNGGAMLTSSNEETVSAVFSVLEGCEVNYVESSPDQHIDLNQTSEYIFTMEDGSAISFLFAQNCLAVTVDRNYGTVYYWLNNLDELWSIEVLPADNRSEFGGGSIAGLRSDLQALQKILSGEGEALEVIGVYVDYSVDDESGYFLLSDDGETKTFLQKMLSVNATTEIVENPAGENITVSVTLSDGSGPIVYFAGDAVQQVVGSWYACDADSMEELRSTVSTLAAEYATNTTEAREAAG